MKNHALFFASLMALNAVPLYTQSETKSEGKFTIMPVYVSNHTHRGIFVGGPSFQPIVEYSKGPLTLGICANFPLTNEIPDFDPADPEFDFIASYEFSIIPDILAIKPGITLYTFPQVKKEDGFYKTTVEPSVSFVYTLSDINFSLDFYYDIMMKGLLYEFVVDYTIPLKQLCLDLELFALAGKYDWSDTVPNEIPKVRDKGDYYKAGLSIPYNFSKDTKLTVGWYYEKATNNYVYAGNSAKELNPSAVSQGVFSAAFSYSF
jgi:hypothetical protein